MRGIGCSVLDIPRFLPHWQKGTGTGNDVNEVSKGVLHGLHSIVELEVVAVCKETVEDGTDGRGWVGETGFGLDGGGADEVDPDGIDGLDGWVEALEVREEDVTFCGGEG